MMISNHYPIMFGHPWSPLIALGIVIVGGLIRHFFNITNHGIADDWSAIASIPAAVVVVLGARRDHRATGPVGSAERARR